MSVAPTSLVEKGYEHEQQFFIQNALLLAREMSVTDAIRFLRGILLSCGDSELTAQVRVAFNALTESDAQLQLLAKQQMILEGVCNG